MSTLHEIIRQELATHNDANDYDIAVTIREQMTEDDMLRLLVAEVGHIRRLRSLSIERKAFEHSSSTPTTDNMTTQLRRTTNISTLLQFAPLYDERFVTARGVWVTWGQATIDDHRARIALLNKQITGIQQTVTQHETAIELIRTQGGTCLADVLYSEVSSAA